MKFSFSHSIKWSIFIFAVTFAVACLLTVTSTTILEGVVWGVGSFIVLIFILIGVFFDILGLAAAAAKETPFHAMGSEKIKGSKQAIYIVRNADRFSNFCNDVIGDMAGVISGSATALVVLKLMTSYHAQHNIWLNTAVSVIFTALVSALTVGGKAMGKSLAIYFSTEIVLLIGRFFYMLEHHLHIKIFNGKKRPKSNNGKRGKHRAARSN